MEGPEILNGTKSPNYMQILLIYSLGKACTTW